MESRAQRRGRQAFWFTVAAFTWSCGLLVAALVAPVYSSASSTSSSGVIQSASQTLVQQNGLEVLLVVSIPAGMVLVAWLALHHKCTHGGHLGGFVAWTLVWVLAAGCVVGAASIGIFIVPVAVCLARAAAITPKGDSRGGALSGAPS